MKQENGIGMNIARRFENILVVEGGAMRSTFSAGVLDTFIRKQFNPFDACVGVSAGACNILSFLGGEPGLSLNLLLQAAESREFINIRRFIMGGELLDMQWLFDHLLTSHIDASHLNNLKPLFIGMTEVASGKAAYEQASDENLVSLLRASMTLPGLCQKFPLVDGVAMVDGGHADAIPLQKAIDLGAKRVVVIRSRHAGYVKQDTMMHRFIRWRLRDHPELVTTMRQRVKRHDDTVRLLSSPPQGVSVVDITPLPEFTMGRFGVGRNDLMNGYRIGEREGLHAIRQWNRICHNGVI